MAQKTERITKRKKEKNEKMCTKPGVARQCMMSRDGGVSSVCVSSYKVAGS